MASALAATGIVLLRNGDTALARRKLTEARALDGNGDLMTADLGRLLKLETKWKPPHFVRMLLESRSSF